MLDWAKSKGIGFSHFISLGDSADVDFGDVLDYLGSDPKTRSILLYIESIKAARKFMSAARAAARNMGELQVRRLPVLNRDKRLVGIVSLGDVALRKKDSAGDALKDVSRPTA